LSEEDPFAGAELWAAFDPLTPVAALLVDEPD